MNGLPIKPSCVQSLHVRNEAVNHRNQTGVAFLWEGFRCTPVETANVVPLLFQFRECFDAVLGSHDCGLCNRRVQVVQLIPPVFEVGELVTDLPHSLVECSRRLGNFVKLGECVVVELPTGVSVVIQQLTLLGGWLEPEPVGAVHQL
jgi:hypothetical protein